MARSFRTIIFIIALTLGTTSAFAACHTVTPSGSGSKTGADWNNAYAGLPGTLVRGDIYYLADGNYNPYTFNTSNSGTTTVEIRKAQPSDHCTGTGWNTSTMGSAQAIMPSIDVTASYLVVNGNGSQTMPGCGGAPGLTVTASPPTKSDCGIKIDNSSCSGAADACDGPISIESGVGHYTFEYLEEQGNGNNSSDEIEVFAKGSTASVSNFIHDYMHNAGCVYLQYGGDQRTVAFSYFWLTQSNSSGCHGQAEFYSPPDSNGINHSNVYRDIQGTAVWTFANPGTGTSTGWEFYDDVIWATSYTSGQLDNGILACINSGVNCTGFTVVQNTIIGTQYANGINNENTGSYTVENNIWYKTEDNTGSPGGITFATGSGGSYTQNHNSFLQSGTSCPSGTSNVCNGSALNPFTNWTTGVFTLVSDASDWNSRLSLSSPYNTDAAGNTFTTDRGAYQSSGSSQAPQAPTSLAVSVQ